MWIIAVYAPIALNWWRILSKLGVLDFAGGTVVHINAGIGLVVALMLGKRRFKAMFPSSEHSPF